MRDGIPEIIKASGRACDVKKLSDSEFLPELEKKLAEEAAEYLKDRSIDELADIIQVIHRILELRGLTREDLEALRLEKRKKRGGFAGNLFLVGTSCNRQSEGNN